MNQANGLMDSCWISGQIQWGEFCWQSAVTPQDGAWAINKTKRFGNGITIRRKRACGYLIPFHGGPRALAWVSGKSVAVT